MLVHSFIASLLSEVLKNGLSNNSRRVLQAAAEKGNKLLQQAIAEVQGRLDEANRTLSDYDAAKRKLALENADLNKQAIRCNMRSSH